MQILPTISTIKDDATAASHLADVRWFRSETNDQVEKDSTEKDDPSAIDSWPIRTTTVAVKPFMEAYNHADAEEAGAGEEAISITRN